MDGIVNYVFEGREQEHKDKQAEVLLYSPDLLVPYSAQDKEGIKKLKANFNARTSSYLKENPENKAPLIGHQILSFTKEDEKKLKKEGIQNVLSEYVEMSGLDQSQFVAVGHRDTANYHIHILFHKVGNDGKKMDDWKLNNKTIERGVSLALKNGWELIKDQKSVALTKAFCKSVRSIRMFWICEKRTITFKKPETSIISISRLNKIRFNRNG